MKEDDIFLEKVRQVIQDNLSNQNLKGEFIARELNLSRMQVHRKLKELMNQNSRGFIMIIRVNYAKQQLKYTTKFIYQIADECGFKDYTYFSRVFKKETGYSPIKYRKLNN